MSDERPPCTLGFLFGACSDERRERNYNVAMGYCDRAGRPRVNPGRMGRPRHVGGYAPVDFVEEPTGQPGGGGGTRKRDGVPRACNTCMEQAVDLLQWLPVGGERRRAEVDLFLLRVAQCVSRGQEAPSYEQFAAELERAQRQRAAAQAYTAACMARAAADERLRLAARACEANDVDREALEQDLDGCRGYGMLNPRKRMRADEADAQRCTYDSGAAFDRADEAYDALEPHSHGAMLRREAREAVKAREARVAEQRAARDAELAEARAAREGPHVAAGVAGARGTASTRPRDDVSDKI